jgi:pyruvate carboxylase subunit B
VKYFVTVEGQEQLIELEDGLLRVNGDEIRAELSSLPGTDRRHLRVEDRSVGLFGRRVAEGWMIELEGRAFELRVEDERARHIRELAGTTAQTQSRIEVRAPMPGLIVKVETEVGREVQSGDGLVVMEAMKMENELSAEASGTVREIHVEPGMTVDRNDLLAVIE